MKIDMWAVKENLKVIGKTILIVVIFSLGLNALGIHSSDDDGDTDYCEMHSALHCG